MGIFILLGWAAGALIGLLGTALAGAVAIPLFVASRLKRPRGLTWLTFFGFAAIAMVGCMTAISYWPFPEMQPGNDYDIMMKVAFQMGIMFSCSLGISWIIGSAGTFLVPQKAPVESAEDTSGVE